VRSVLLVLLAIALTASDSAAQRSIARRFMAGVYLHAVAVDGPVVGSSVNSTQVGGGPGARLGWGITQRITLFTALSLDPLAYDKSDSSTNALLIHGALGASYHFAKQGRAFVPYLEIARAAIALEARTTDATTGVTSFGTREGLGWTIGGGLDRYYSESWAFNAALHVSVGDVGRRGTATITRLSVGTTYRPYEPALR
jgi:hypothetical protein